MKTNRILLLASVLCFSLIATGCGEPLYEMTSEEEAIITLYASKAVAKFNKNQVIGIANARVKKGELDDEYVPDEDQEDQEEVPEETSTEELIDPETGEPVASEESDAVESSNEGTSDETSNNDEDSSVDSGYSFTNAVGIEGVEFTCSEFDVTTEYKASSSFVLTQIKGKKYLVLYIEAENKSDSAVDFSKYSNREYSLSLNGGEKSKSQYTPVSNDLSTFRGSMKPGEKKSFIIVFSFSNSAVESISSLELYVSSDGSTRGTTI